MYKFSYKQTDIKLVNGLTYKEFRPDFNLNKFKDFLISAPYKGEGLIKDISVENAQLPPIVQTFYSLYAEGIIPSAETLFKYYIKTNFIEIDDNLVQLNNTSSVFKKHGIKARLFRTYPSIIRDFHFYMLCFYSQKFQSVSYSVDKDYIGGIDLSIKYKGVGFSIALLVDTPRSNSFKKKKAYRHSNTPVHEICVRINPFESKFRVGNYTLYSEYHLNLMIAEMESIINSIDSAKIAN